MLLGYFHVFSLVFGSIIKVLKGLKEYEGEAQRKGFHCEIKIDYALLKLIKSS